MKRKWKTVSKLLFFFFFEVLITRFLVNENLNYSRRNQIDFKHGKSSLMAHDGIAVDIYRLLLRRAAYPCMLVGLSRGSRRWSKRR